MSKLKKHPEETDKQLLLNACKNLMKAVCFGKHGNIKDSAYICLAVSSPEIRLIKQAIAKTENSKENQNE